MASVCLDRTARATAAQSAVTPGRGMLYAQTMNRIALLGATGYTGALVAEWAAHQGIGLIIGGRDPQRLEQVNRVCGGIHEPRTVDVSDPASIDRLLQGASVLIDTAGPFIDLGPPVIERCLAAGVHFLDTTGEQRYIREVFERFGATALKAGVSLVPSMAFEYALGDGAAELLAQRLPDLSEVDAFYYVPGFATSRGTKLSALKIFGDETYCFRDGALQPQPPGVAANRTYFLDEPGVHAALNFPGGEPVLLPRHLAVRDVRSWMVMKPNAMRAFRPVAGALSGRLPLIGLIERSLKSSKRGPDPAERSAARFKVLLRGVSATGAARCQVWGNDMYLLTAKIILYGALRLADEPDLPRGALTPAQCFGGERLLGDLAAYGVRTACEGP